MCVFECVKFTRYVILLLSFIQQMKTRRVCAPKLSFIFSRIKNGFYFPIQKYTINSVFFNVLGAEKWWKIAWMGECTANHNNLFFSVFFLDFG